MKTEHSPQPLPQPTNGQKPQPLLPQANGKPSQLLPLIYTNQPAETDEEGVDLRQWLAIVRRRALVIVGVAVAVTAAIALKTLTETPQYQGKFRLLVEPVTSESKLAQQFIQAQVPGGKPDSSTLDYDTQIEVLRSPKLLAPIVQTLQVQAHQLNYEALLEQLSVTRLAQTKILEVRYLDPDPNRIQVTLELLAQTYLKYSLQQRQTSIRQGIVFIEEQLPSLRLRVDQLQGRLQRLRQQSNLIDPESQGQQLSAQLDTIESQRLEARTKLSEAQLLYSNLQGQLGLQPEQAIAASALSEAPRYQALLNRLLEIESKIALESARFSERAPIIQALRNQQQNLLPLLNQEAQRALGSRLSRAAVNPQTLASQNSIRQTLTQQLVDTANQVQVLAVRNQAIAQAANLLNQRARQFPVITRQYADLQRELQIATSTLNDFLTKREALRIDAAQQEIPWELIADPTILRDPQGAPLPVSPNLHRNLSLGAILGLLLGLGAALVVENLKKSLQTPEQVKDATGLPLLGAIPFNGELRGTASVANLAGLPQADGRKLVPGRGNAPGRYRAGLFLEAFRSLHTNLRFLRPERPIRSLVVSSATPAEGKSTVATHLAQVAAAAGKRVLLVDADLRRPQVHLRYGLANQHGLSDAITIGLTVEREESAHGNLFVLTSGEPPADPTTLLASQQMQALMARFRTVFDLVIYDTPPLLGFADGKLLAAHVDGVVLVVGLGKTRRSTLKQALDSLAISHAPVLGVVANGVKGGADSSYEGYDRYYAQANQDAKARN